MLEKLLLAGTITFSLNLFLGIGVHTPSQPTITAQSTPKQSTPAQLPSTQPTHQSVYLAKALHENPLLRGLFQ